MKKSKLLKIVREATKEVLNEQPTGYMCHENVTLSTIGNCPACVANGGICGGSSSGYPSSTNGCGANLGSGNQHKLHHISQPGGFTTADLGTEFTVPWSNFTLPNGTPVGPYVGELCWFSPPVPCTAPLDPMLAFSPTTIVSGCNNANYCNYDPNVNCPDNSCSGYYGCTNLLASNYDPNAGCDDGSCLGASGCMDPLALNYDPNAVTDDGSCTYPVLGCTDLAANNYDPLATQDDGSCTYNLGCTDDGGSTNLDVFTDGTNIVGIFPNPTNPGFAACNYDDDPNITHDPGTCNNLTPCMVCAPPIAPGNFGQGLPDTNNLTGLCYGCLNCPNCSNYNGNYANDDGSCLGCTDPAACNYEPLATIDDGSCNPIPICNTDPCVGDIMIVDPADLCACIVDEPQVLGCMDVTAFNFDCSTALNPNSSTACLDDVNCDDGSCCFIGGCTDSTSTNYDPLACADDGSCIPPACTYVGLNPPTTISQQLTNGCDPNASYHSWPHDYQTYGPQFIWHGMSVPTLGGWSPLTNGDPVSPAYVNFILANQHSYCEWCHDFVQGSSTQFNTFLPHWHNGHGNISPTVSPTGPWNLSFIPQPPESMCCCCPDWGGNQYNSGGIQMSTQPNPNPQDIDVNNPFKNINQQNVCCNWCSTLTNQPSTPPAGCEDWMCDYCRGGTDTPTIIPESLIKRFQKLANIKK